MTSVRLPAADRTLQHYELQSDGHVPAPKGPARSRIAFAAAHIVADPYCDNTPGASAQIDWDATLAFRRHLVSYGFGVAEAMDTAQRGMGLDWAAAQELIRRSAADIRSLGGRIAAGVGTDHLAPVARDLGQVLAAYETQLAFVESTGAQGIVMASRHLAKLARAPEDYRAVYDKLLAQVSHPVILHWLGTAFDPALEGYWGSADIDVATEAFLHLVRDNADAIDGVKVSLLDADREIALRAALPAGVRLYTGDDFNYPQLIRGGDGYHSDALLGVFAAIAPAASEALHALDRGDEQAYDDAFSPTLPLARHLFSAPTYYYKTGIAFLAWLSGFQPGFTMVGGLQSARSVPHLVRVFMLADAAKLFPDPELTAHRMSGFLQVVGAAP